MNQEPKDSPPDGEEPEVSAAKPQDGQGLQQDGPRRTPGKGPATPRDARRDAQFITLAIAFAWLMCCALLAQLTLEHAAQYGTTMDHIVALAFLSNGIVVGSANCVAVFSPAMTLKPLQRLLMSFVVWLALALALG